MCVSDHMGLQNRVGRSGFFVCNIFVLYLRVRFETNFYLKTSQSGPIYIIFVIYDPQ